MDRIGLDHVVGPAKESRIVAKNAPAPMPARLTCVVQDLTGSRKNAGRARTALTRDTGNPARVTNDLGRRHRPLTRITPALTRVARSSTRVTASVTAVS